MAAFACLRVAFLLLAIGAGEQPTPYRRKLRKKGGKSVAISKARKEELVAQYTNSLKGTDGFVIIQTTGMTVKQTQELRAKIREAQGNFARTKVTLFRIALNDAGWPVPEDLLNGPVSVAFGNGNFPNVAKVVLDFMKDLSEKMQIRGGVIGGNIINDRQVDTMSKLPTMDELRSQLAGLIVQPATGLVTVLNAATGQVVNVLHAYVKEKGGDAA
jgi:large subunit ribosomal protein L10